MDETAKMLEAYAGGLQQSFGSVFERVGQSLSQSAQVMHMMNEVMESAMLQNLVISTAYEVGGTLIIDVLNDSRITLGQTKIRAQLHDSNKAFFSETIDNLQAGIRVQVQAPIDNVVGPIQGFIELECISPGTQQPLIKRSSFRILSFQRGSFQRLKCGENEAVPDVSEAAVISDKIELTRLRDLLQLSPVEGMLINDQGRYRFCPEPALRCDIVFYLSVRRREESDTVYQVTIYAAGSSQADSRQRLCQKLIDELESVNNVT